MDKDMWEMHCKGAFGEIQSELRDIKKLLVGNGTEGLADKVRNHERYFKAIIGVAIFLVTTAVLQTFIWVRSHL